MKGKEIKKGIRCRGEAHHSQNGLFLYWMGKEREGEVLPAFCPQVSMLASKSSGGGRGGAIIFGIGRVPLTYVLATGLIAS